MILVTFWRLHEILLVFCNLLSLILRLLLQPPRNFLKFAPLCSFIHRVHTTLSSQKFGLYMTILARKNMAFYV